MKLKLFGIVAIAALALLGACTSSAQTTYDNVPANFVNVNSGDPAWATFYFGHPVNGQPGTTALIIQCVFHRAELITNFDAQGQAVSHFFAMTCSSVPGSGYREVIVTLDGTPLSESLVMVNTDGSTFPLTLTINSATWDVTYSGTRSQKASGNSQIVVGGTQQSNLHKPGTCWWDGKGAGWQNIQCSAAFISKTMLCTDTGGVWWPVGKDSMCYAADKAKGVVLPYPQRVIAAQN